MVIILSKLTNKTAQQTFWSKAMCMCSIYFSYLFNNTLSYQVSREKCMEATEEEEEEVGVECSDGVDYLRRNGLRHYCPRCQVGGSSPEAQFASVCRFSPPPSFAGSSESDVYRSSFTPAYQPIAFLHAGSSLPSWHT